MYGFISGFSVLFHWSFLMPVPCCVACCCSVAKLCLTLCNSMNWSMLGFPVLCYLPEFAQTHVYWVDDAIQLSHTLTPHSSLAFNLSQHQGLFQWVGCLHWVAKVLELQHQSFQMNIQGLFPLGLTRVISLWSTGLSGVFSSTTVWRH